jgi:hypothetical protein
MGERLAIEADRIAAVWLADGNWHPVKPSSFESGTTWTVSSEKRIVATKT